jgi:hypothetical protein
MYIRTHVTQLVGLMPLVCLAVSLSAEMKGKRKPEAAMLSAPQVARFRRHKKALILLMVLRFRVMRQKLWQQESRCKVGLLCIGLEQWAKAKLLRLSSGHLSIQIVQVMRNAMEFRKRTSQTRTL